MLEAHGPPYRVTPSENRAGKCTCCWSNDRGAAGDLVSMRAALAAGHKHQSSKGLARFKALQRTSATFGKPQKAVKRVRTKGGCGGGIVAPRGWW